MSFDSAIQVVEALSLAERGAVLDALLDAQPELLLMVEPIARTQLSNVTEDVIAEEVEVLLMSLSMELLATRSGKVPFGYVEPTQAAWDILGEAVEPYEQSIARLLTFEMEDAAVETLLGVVSGLYRCRHAHDIEDLLLAWAVDFPDEHAAWIVRKAAERGLDIPATRLTDAAPNWFSDPEASTH